MNDQQLKELVEKVNNLEKGYKDLCSANDRSKQAFLHVIELQKNSKKMLEEFFNELTKVTGKDKDRKWILDLLVHNVESLINMFVKIDEDLSENSSSAAMAITSIQKRLDEIEKRQAQWSVLNAVA